MYLQFYGFKEAPFNLTPDSKFLFLSHRHQEALAALLFGVQERKGFICLTGEIGCGKTTLCRALLNQLDPEQVRVCVVLNSYLNDLELLKTINEGYGLAAESDSKKTLLDTLNNFLIAEFSQGHNVVLIVDEAQNLRPETLEQIRMISNLETETAKLIQIVMVGQPELRRTLALPELEQLNQRVSVRYHITTLETAEIVEYIRHRLAVAEPQVQVQFTDQAAKLISHYSRGVPRRINVICDRCLLIGYVQGTFTIGDKLVEQAIAEIRGQTPGFEASSAAAAEIAREGVPRWLVRLGKSAVGVATVAAGVALGLWALDYYERGRQPDAPPQVSAAQVAALSTPAPTPTPAATPAATPEPTAAPTPAPTPATPTPAPTPTPATYANWQHDPNGVLRVNQAELAEAAAYLTLLELWGVPVDLAPWREAAPAEVAQIDMPATIAQVNFRTHRTDKLSEALRLNLPVLVRLAGGSAVSPFGVIESMRGEYLELIDPIAGKRNVRRTQLEPLVGEAIVVYQDQHGLTGLAIGANGEPVQTLQQVLASDGQYTGQLDGIFGAMTREALVRLQRSVGLEPSGQVDPPTAAWISTRLNLRGPTLD